MRYKIIVPIAALFILIFIASAWYIYKNQIQTPPATPTAQLAPEAPSNTEKVTPTTTTAQKTITFNNDIYTVDFAGPSEQLDFTSESAEWVTGGETVENWTRLITTHILTPLHPETPLSAEAYAQNVTSLNEQNGAFIIETSLINQDMEALGVDPNYPPYFLTYLYVQDGTTEFNMQKIFQLPGGKVGSVIYAERFPTKSEPEMKAFFESPETSAKRIELIKLFIKI